MGVHVEEFAGQHERRLGMQELPPSRVGVPDRSRRYPPLAAGRGGWWTSRTRWPSLEQLALAFSCIPAGILPGHAFDQLGHGGGDGRASEAMWIGPCPGDQADDVSAGLCPV